MNGMNRSATALQAPVRLVVVAAAHVLAVWAIANALNVPGLIREPHIDWIPVPDVKDPKPTIHPPAPNGGKPKFTEIHPTDPPLPPPVDVGKPDQPDTITVSTDPGPGTGTELTPQWIGPRLDAAHPLTQPEYPAASIRLEESGVVDLELQLAPDGRVIEARVLRSSGIARLDAAAIKEALQHWRLLPALENGQPVASVYRQRVTFRLQDAL